MEYTYLVLLCSLLPCFTSSGAGREAPNFVHPCIHATDACLKTAIQEALPGFVRGVPELGIESMDPYTVDKLSLTLPGGLKVTFTHGVTEGYDGCVVRDAKLLNHTIKFEVRCTLTVTGKYVSTGKILIFPINGAGDSYIKCHNLDQTISLQLEPILRDGKQYLQLQRHSTSHRYSGRVVYHMTNLVQNSPFISNLVLKFMNKHWRLIAEKFGDPVVAVGARIVMKNIEQLFKTVPMLELIRLTF